jgi:hypothetical protein
VKSVELSTTGAIEHAIVGSPQDDVVIFRDGEPVALVTPFDADDLYWYRREHDPAFIESIALARADIAAGKVISQEDLIRKLGLD